jgi:hypothetical protein
MKLTHPYRTYDDLSIPFVVSTAALVQANAAEAEQRRQAAQQAIEDGDRIWRGMWNGMVCTILLALSLFAGGYLVHHALPVAELQAAQRETLTEADRALQVQSDLLTTNKP